jgi:hypothetical protein
MYVIKVLNCLRTMTRTAARAWQLLQRLLWRLEDFVTTIERAINIVVYRVLL